MIIKRHCWLGVVREREQNLFSAFTQHLPKGWIWSEPEHHFKIVGQANTGKHRPGMHSLIGPRQNVLLINGHNVVWRVFTEIQHVAYLPQRPVRYGSPSPLSLPPHTGRCPRLWPERCTGAGEPPPSPPCDWVAARRLVSSKWSRGRG